MAHWRHGWVPLDPEAVAEKEHRTTKADVDKAAMLNKPDSGFSINAKGESPKSGYMVAYDEAHGGTERVLEGKVHGADIAAHRVLSRHMLSDPANFHGAWVDPDTGKTYLDVSRNVQGLSDAAKMAATQHQLSIYDVKGGRSIPTKDAIKTMTGKTNG